MRILTPDIYKKEIEITPLEKSDGNLTLSQFFELMYYVLDVEMPNLVFVPSYPKYIISGTPEYKKTMENPAGLFRDTITYHVNREEPGSVGGNKQPFGGTREVTPRIREMNKEKNIQINGQWFDTLVQFDIWCLSNFEVEKLALWFKRFMMQYRDFFKHLGLSELLFWWRGRDSNLASMNNELQSRTLIYFVRTEEISVVDINKLKSIELEIFARFGDKIEKM